MLYLFGGRTNPIVRVLIGLALLAIGLAKHGMILDALGAVMLLWAAVSMPAYLRHRRDNNGGLPR
jgi:hypothetical protein